MVYANNRNPKKVTTLLMRQEGLTCFPKEIFNYPNLRKLDLSSNDISCVPSEILKLRKLKVLIISNNKLRQVHAAVFRLKLLTILDISHNFIKAIPAQLKSSNIKTLIANNNQLTDWNIKNLSGLQKLIMDNNKFSVITIASILPNLKYLSLINTNPEILNIKSGSLPVLKGLYLFQPNGVVRLAKKGNYICEYRKTKVDSNLVYKNTSVNKNQKDMDDNKILFDKVDKLKRNYVSIINSGKDQYNVKGAIDCYLAWYSNANKLFDRFFTNDNSEYARFKNMSNGGNGYVLYDNYKEIIGVYDVLMDRIARSLLRDNNISKDITPGSKNVFIVHGRDDGMLDEVSLYLKSIGLIPVILYKETNAGRTLIEKFETFSSKCRYAIILLSPDDIGALTGEHKSEMEKRARQNVVFEFGYFIGKLGRANVCSLLKGGVVEPSDLDGLVYIPYDGNGDWKKILCREIKAAKLV